MGEVSKNSGGVVNNNLAIQIKNATFAWEETEIDLKRRGSPVKVPTSKAKKSIFYLLVHFMCCRINQN